MQHAAVHGRLMLRGSGGKNCGAYVFAEERKFAGSRFIGLRPNSSRHSTQEAVLEAFNALLRYESCAMACDLAQHLQCAKL